ncbi:recombinase family protein [Paracoccus caeni]|uniref:Recombinase family protein n=2 Tax=Paracoccus caeni TaxID=657651 RepID=A0A934SI42_9RHOB|nr:recombinase family protein [Paracoccus caeni]
MSASRPLRAAIYARYSSDLQREASLEDQIRLCHKMCDDNGWLVTETFQDRAVSGSSDLRADFQRLRQSASKGQFDIVVAEALDRFSRDQEHIAGFHKQMSFQGIRIVTKTEGEINEMHIGLGGTMAALYIKHLAQKTHRGLEGRVRSGKSAGGIGYGYRVDRQALADGSMTAGDRVIHQPEAAIVRRIFQEYAAGKSARSIAMALNAESITSPASGRSSGTWSFSTIGGNWKRGTGILNNELYVGKLVWNRLHYRKDPSTGKRVSRLNPPEDWIIEEMPQLAIVDQALWERVKVRQQATREEIFETRAANPDAPGTQRGLRPRYLLSDLIRCGCCGGGYSMISKSRLGCSTARNKGTCTNRRTILREEVEERVLSGLRTRLMRPDLLRRFIDEFQREVRQGRLDTLAERADLERRHARVKKSIDNIITAITEGLYSSSMKEKMDALEAERAEIEAALERTLDPSPVEIHPGHAAIYEKKVAALSTALNAQDTRAEAAMILRGLIEKVVIHPGPEAQEIDLYGELGAILSLCANPDTAHADARRNGGRLRQVTMVAGAGFEPAAFRL